MGKDLVIYIDKKEVQLCNLNINSHTGIKVYKSLDNRVWFDNWGEDKALLYEFSQFNNSAYLQPNYSLIRDNTKKVWFIADYIPLTSIDLFNFLEIKKPDNFIFNWINYLYGLSNNYPQEYKDLFYNPMIQAKNLYEWINKPYRWVLDWGIHNFGMLNGKIYWFDPIFDLWKKYPLP